MKVVTSGSFVRSIHAYGSSGIIILLLLHIGQTILYGSYKGRRELLWLSGCILLALMLAMAFTGYLLPWDEKAYFATAVGTNLIGEVPFIGPPLEQLVRGGDQMGTLTVSRFFVLHVFVLPALLIGFIAAHVFFFRKAGAAGPIKEDPVHPKLPSVNFYPRQVVMDAVFAIVLIGILAVIAVHLPMDLGPAANPANTHFLPRPDWYYRPRFSGSSISAAVGIWWYHPACDTRVDVCRGAISGSPARAPSLAPANLSGRLFCFPDCLYFSWCSQLSGRLPRSWGGGADAHAGRGCESLHAEALRPGSCCRKRIGCVGFRRPGGPEGTGHFPGQSCSSCHGEGGVGTAAAVALTGIGQKYTDTQLIALLRAPNRKMSDGGMAAVDLKQGDLEALVAYLRQLH